MALKNMTLEETTLENIKLLDELWEALIKLINDYSSIVSEAKYETIHGT